MRRPHSLLAVLPVLAALSFWAMSGSARANTATFSGDANGTIDYFETAETAVQFYGRRNFPPFPVNDDGLNFFFHRDTTTGIFSMGFVVDNRGDFSAAQVSGTITGLTPGATVALSDDRNELQMIGPSTAVFNWSVGGCCTDGGIITGLDPANLTFNITLTSGTGLTNTYLVGPSGTLSLGVCPDRRG